MQNLAKKCLLLSSHQNNGKVMSALNTVPWSSTSLWYFHIFFHSKQEKSEKSEN